MGGDEWSRMTLWLLKKRKHLSDGHQDNPCEAARCSNLEANRPRTSGQQDVHQVGGGGQHPQLSEAHIGGPPPFDHERQPLLHQQVCCIVQRHACGGRGGKQPGLDESGGSGGAKCNARATRRSALERCAAMHALMHSTRAPTPPCMHAGLNNTAREREKEREKEQVTGLPHSRSCAIVRNTSSANSTMLPTCHSVRSASAAASFIARRRGESTQARHRSAQPLGVESGRAPAAGGGAGAAARQQPDGLGPPIRSLWLAGGLGGLGRARQGREVGAATPNPAVVSTEAAGAWPTAHKVEDQAI